MKWVSQDRLFEAARKRRMAYKSGRREFFGLGVKVGERAGEVRLRVKRKRPKKNYSPISRSIFKKRKRKW